MKPKCFKCFNFGMEIFKSFYYSTLTTTQRNSGPLIEMDEPRGGSDKHEAAAAAVVFAASLLLLLQQSKLHACTTVVVVSQTTSAAELQNTDFVVKQTLLLQLLPVES